MTKAELLRILKETLKGVNIEGNNDPKVKQAKEIFDYLYTQQISSLNKQEQANKLNAINTKIQAANRNPVAIDNNNLANSFPKYENVDEVLDVIGEDLEENVDITKQINIGDPLQLDFQPGAQVTRDQYIDYLNRHSSYKYEKEHANETVNNNLKALDQCIITGHQTTQMSEYIFNGLSDAEEKELTRKLLAQHYNNDASKVENDIKRGETNYAREKNRIALEQLMDTPAALQELLDAKVITKSDVSYNLNNYADNLSQKLIEVATKYNKIDKINEILSRRQFHNYIPGFKDYQAKEIRDEFIRRTEPNQIFTLPKGSRYAEQKTVFTHEKELEEIKNNPKLSTGTEDYNKALDQVKDILIKGTGEYNTYLDYYRNLAENGVTAVIKEYQKDTWKQYNEMIGPALVVTVVNGQPVVKNKTTVLEGQQEKYRQARQTYDHFVLSDQSKQGMLEMFKKFDEMNYKTGIIGEEGTKSYGLANLSQARIQIKQDVEKLASLKDSNDEKAIEEAKQKLVLDTQKYQKDLQDFRDLQKISKKYYDNAPIVSTNIDVCRNSELPPEIREDYVGTSQINGAFHVYTLLKTYNIPFEEYLKDPQKVYKDLINNKLYSRDEFNVTGEEKDFGELFSKFIPLENGTKWGVDKNNLHGNIMRAMEYTVNADPENMKNNHLVFNFNYEYDMSVKKENLPANQRSQAEREEIFERLLLVDDYDNTMMNNIDEYNLDTGRIERKPDFDLDRYLENHKPNPDVVQKRFATMVNKIEDHCQSPTNQADHISYTQKFKNGLFSEIATAYVKSVNRLIQEKSIDITKNPNHPMVQLANELINNPEKALQSLGATMIPCGVAVEVNKEAREEFKIQRDLSLLKSGALKEKYDQLKLGQKYNAKQLFSDLNDLYHTSDHRDKTDDFNELMLQTDIHDNTATIFQQLTNDRYSSFEKVEDVQEELREIFKNEFNSKEELDKFLANNERNYTVLLVKELDPIIKADPALRAAIANKNINLEKATRDQLKQVFIEQGKEQLFRDTEKKVPWNTMVPPVSLHIDNYTKYYLDKLPDDMEIEITKCVPFYTKEDKVVYTEQEKVDKYKQVGSIKDDQNMLKTLDVANQALSKSEEKYSEYIKEYRNLYELNTNQATNAIKKPLFEDAKKKFKPIDMTPEKTHAKVIVHEPIVDNAEENKNAISEFKLSERTLEGIQKIMNKFDEMGLYNPDAPVEEQFKNYAFGKLINEKSKVRTEFNKLEAEQKKLDEINKQIEEAKQEANTLQTEEEKGQANLAVQYLEATKKLYEQDFLEAMQNLNKATTSYEKTLNDYRELISISKEYFGDNVLINTNVDIARNSAYPPELRDEIKATSQINGINMIYGLIKGKNITIDDFTKNPQQFIDEIVDENSSKVVDKYRVTGEEKTSKELFSKVVPIAYGSTEFFNLVGDFGKQLRSLDCLTTLDKENFKHNAVAYEYITDNKGGEISYYLVNYTKTDKELEQMYANVIMTNMEDEVYKTNIENKPAFDFKNMKVVPAGDFDLNKYLQQKPFGPNQMFVYTNNFCNLISAMYDKYSQDPNNPINNDVCQKKFNEQSALAVQAYTKHMLKLCAENNIDLNDPKNDNLKFLKNLIEDPNKTINEILPNNKVIESSIKEESLEDVKKNLKAVTLKDLNMRDVNKSINTLEKNVVRDEKAFDKQIETINKQINRLNRHPEQNAEQIKNLKVEKATKLMTHVTELHNKFVSGELPEGFVRSRVDQLKNGQPIGNLKFFNQKYTMSENEYNTLAKNGGVDQKELKNSYNNFKNRMENDKNIFIAQKYGKAKELLDFKYDLNYKDLNTNQELINYANEINGLTNPNVQIQNNINQNIVEQANNEIIQEKENIHIDLEEPEDKKNEIIKNNDNPTLNKTNQLE